MEAKEVVKAGVRRSIGNGKDTRVWHVPWLPSKDNGCLTTEMPDHLKDITVNSLMDATGSRWDMDVIEDVFNSRDVELIKRVPLPLREKNDSWFWLFDDKGLFTVKSCYRWLQGECDSVHKWFWKKLWELRMPGKVTHFLWRLSKGCLPTAHALAVKQVVANTQCPWCQHAVETDTHVLFTCDFARTVWYSAGMQVVMQVSPHDTAFMILVRLFETCTKEQCVQIALISWCIWNRRNKWFWDRVNGSAFGVKAAATNFLEDWREAQITATSRGANKETVANVWRKPMEGWVKVNTDAAVFNNGSIGLGCVLRNSQGAFMGARSCKVEGAWTPREAEAIGMKEALSWMIARKIDHCIIETDSQILAAACTGEPGLDLFGTIVGDCIQLLKHINPVLVKFVYRSANSVAHELAKAAYSMSEIGEWHDIPPAFIMHVLDLDLI